MMLVQKYSLETCREQLPDMVKFSQAKKEKAMFYLGIMSYINLMTQAQKETDERQVIINELLLDEIDTEGLILHQELKNALD